jgi:hypothetical protein
MRTHLAKRWPALLTLLIALAAAGVASHTFFVRALAFIAVELAGAIILRFAVGWPWRRILWYWN